MPDFPSDPFGGGQLDFTLRQMQSNIDDAQRKIDDLNNLLRGYNSQQIAGFDLSGNPYVFETLARQLGNWAGIALVTAWPFKVYNTTTGSTGQVQINGGDGFVGSLNGLVATVGGNPIDTLVSGAYPQLAVTGNGAIYAYATPTTPGTANPLSALPIYYAGTLPSPDTASPNTYFCLLIATISSYATDGSGNVSFIVNNTTNTGFATLIYCGPTLQAY